MKLRFVTIATENEIRDNS